MPRSQIRLAQAGIAAGTLGAVLLVAPGAALASPSIGPSLVPPNGNATIFDPQANFSIANAAVQISTTACSTKYVAAGVSGPWNATVGNKTPTSVSFTMPAGVAGGANGTVKPYNVCLYDGTTVSTSSLQSSGSIYVGQPVWASAMTGPAGGGNQITLNGGSNAPLFTGYASLAVIFTTGSCNSALGANNAPSLTASGVVRQSTSAASFTVPSGAVAANGPAPTMYNVCVYDGSSSTGSLLTVTPYTVYPVSLSPAAGSFSSSNGVTASAATAFLSGVSNPAVLLWGPGAGCAPMYSAAPNGGVTPIVLGNNAGEVRRLSNNRAALTIPPLALGPNNQPNTYQVCFYSDNTANGTLLGTAGYTASVVAAPTAVIPAAGPAAGGNVITIVGSNFPTDPSKITATLGGAPLTILQSISDKAFTAQVPAHAVGNGVTLVVSTASGSKALPGAYSFLNPVTVSPNTAPSTTSSFDVDVQGSGFLGINFGTGGTAGRVFLVDGVYDGTDAGGGVRANGPVAECGNVLPVSDTELICTLQLNRRLNNLGTGFFDPVGYSNTLTSDVSTVAGSKVITSAAGKFSPNDVGQPITQSGNTNIPAGSLVTSVLSASKAVISAPSPATASAITAAIGGAAAHSIATALLTTTGSTTVSLTSGAFTGADVGRVFNGTPGIANGTTIVSVAPGGAGATLSAAATASTQATLADVSVTSGSTTLTGASITSADLGDVIGANPLGIPAGTTITAATAGTATLSAAATVGGGPASIPVTRPISASLYAAAPVPNGSYQLTVVSDGAPSAAQTDPGYTQSDVSSGSVFTVAPF